MKTLRLLNAKGISVLFLVIAMLLMVMMAYVFSYLIPTGQRSISLVIHSTQAFFLAQSGVEFAVRYAADSGWASKTLLSNLNNMTRNLGRGQFTLRYDNVNDKLTSAGEIPNAGKRVITVSNFSTFVSQQVLILDPNSPGPCLKQSIEVDFTIRNVSGSSVTLNAFSSSWMYDPPTRRISTVYLGEIFEFNGNYKNGDSATRFNVPPATYTINAGQTAVVKVHFTHTIYDLHSMIVTFYDTAGNSYDFNLDPGGVGLPTCP